jgi:hypothetical protein
MIKSLFSLMIVFFLFSGTEASADEKPKINVRFNMGEGGYRDTFLPDEITQIQTRVSKSLEPMLNSRFGFIRFTGKDIPDKLEVTLDKRRDIVVAGAIIEVGFYFEISGPRVVAMPKPVYFMFRSPETHALISPTVEGFIRELQLALNSYLDSHENELIGKLFSKVVLSEEAHIIPQQYWWILPFSRDQLGLDIFSKFSIENKYQHPSGPFIPRIYTVKVIEFAPSIHGLPPRFRTGLLTEAIPEQPDLEDVQQFQDMRTTKVFIDEYIRGIAPVVESTQPGAFNPED